MALFTIKIQGIEEKKRILDLIMQNVSRHGIHKIEITQNDGHEDLAANELVQFNVLTRTLKNGMTKMHENYFLYTEGENFAEAKVLGAYKYIEKRKNEINPPKLNRFLKFITNNPLVVGILSAIAGALITLFFTQD